MEDYLSEDEKWEQLKVWLRANFAWMVAGVALGGLVVAGYLWWKEKRETDALEASTQYEEIMAAYTKGDRTRAITLTGELERDHPSSAYLDQAHLLEARFAVQNGQLDKAAGTLTSVMQKTKDPQLALVARLRLARVQLAQDKPDDALTTLSAAQDPGAFAARYQEARGDIQLAKGDKAAALKEYRAARDAGDTRSVDGELLDLKINDLTDGAQPEK